MQEAIINKNTIKLQSESGAVHLHIDKVIGFGANCIVYDVHREDESGHMYSYRMKELFPYNAGVSRTGFNLIWPDNEKKTAAFAKFKDTYYKMLDMQRDPAFGNQTTHVLALYEGNNTLYSLMSVDFGDTFDHVQINSLEDLLLAIYDLSRVVSAYHNRGLLHLDLKPQNFLISYKPVRTIRLFDMDTVTSIDDLKHSTIAALSYSEGWCAPEQRQGTISRISPATDVYAIGAILFQKIMGRIPNSLDTNKFAEWEYDSELFQDINPSIRRILTDIFHHTISASPARRYSDAGELSCKLEKAIEAARQRVFILSDCPINTVDFIGRTKELRAIHDALASDKKTVLHGFGGMGKSTLALEYAARYKSEYDAVIFLRYQNSIRDLLLSINIFNYDEDDEKRRLKQLKQLLNPHVLLIIDNFDVALGEDPDFEDLLRLKAKILITSRTDFADLYQGELVQIECDELPVQELEELFANNSGMTVNEQDRPTLTQILQKTAYHTFATVLAAKQAAASGWSLQTLNIQLGKGIGFLQHERINLQKDGRIIRSNALDAIRALFNLAELDEAARQVLRDLYVLGFLQLTISDYRYIVGADISTVDKLNELAELGYVQRTINQNRVMIGLHPLIQSVVYEEYQPSLENCEKIALYADRQRRKCNTENYCFSPLETAEWEAATEFLGGLLYRIDFSPNALKLLFDFLGDLLLVEYDRFPSRYDYAYKLLFDKLENIEDSDSISETERLNILSFLIMTWIEEYSTIWLEFDPGRADFEKTRKEKATQYIAAQMLLLNKFGEEELKSNMILKRTACKLADDLMPFGKDYPENLKEYLTKLSSLFPEDDDWDGLDFTIKYLDQEYPDDFPEKPEVELTNQEKLERKYHTQIYATDDKSAVVKSIMQDSDFTFNDKCNVIFWECLEPL